MSRFNRYEQLIFALLLAWLYYRFISEYFLNPTNEHFTNRARLHGCDTSSFRDLAVYPNYEKYDLEDIEQKLHKHPITVEQLTPEVNWSQPGDCAKFNEMIVSGGDFTLTLTYNKKISTRNAILKYFRFFGDQTKAENVNMTFRFDGDSWHTRGCRNSNMQEFIEIQITQTWHSNSEIICGTHEISNLMLMLINNHMKIWNPFFICQFEIRRSASTFQVRLLQAIANLKSPKGNTM